MRLSDTLALGEALIRLDGGLVAGHELGIVEAGQEAQVFVGVDEYRGPLTPNPSPQRTGEGT
jgi:hypothetical protein